MLPKNKHKRTKLHVQYDIEKLRSACSSWLPFAVFFRSLLMRWPNPAHVGGNYSLHCACAAFGRWTSRRRRFWCWKVIPAVSFMKSEILYGHKSFVFARARALNGFASTGPPKTREGFVEKSQKLIKMLQNSSASTVIRALLDSHSRSSLDSLSASSSQSCGKNFFTIKKIIERWTRTGMFSMLAAFIRTWKPYFKCSRMMVMMCEGERERAKHWTPSSASPALGLCVYLSSSIDNMRSMICFSWPVIRCGFGPGASRRLFPIIARAASGAR